MVEQFIVRAMQVGAGLKLTKNFLRPHPGPETVPKYSRNAIPSAFQITCNEPDLRVGSDEKCTSCH